VPIKGSRLLTTGPVAFLLLGSLSILSTNNCAHDRGASAGHAGETDGRRLLEIERLGGLAGFGTPSSHLRSRGQLDISTLSAEDRRAVQLLFSRPPPSSSKPDELRDRLTRWTDKGPESIEVPETQVPAAVRSAIKDQLQ
jgi:hypothetical protein